MVPRLINFTTTQDERLKAVKESTELTVTDVVRRIVDWGLRQDVLNQIIPICSGRMEYDR